MKKNIKVDRKKIKTYMGVLFKIFFIASIIWTYFFIKNNVYDIMTSEIIQDTGEISKNNITNEKLEKLLNQIEEKNNAKEEKESANYIIYKNIFK